MLATRREARFADHVLHHTVVLDELRTLFLPVPKAGCTSMLWLLAGLARVAEDALERSTLPEPSASLTVHDMNAWDAGHRLADHGTDDRRRVLEGDGWLRFTVVRDPWSRLWSGWQSKLLLREPRFTEAFGDRPWFPRVPGRPQEIVEDFRRFVAAVGAGDATDVHWAVQHELVAQLPLDHVGRVERMGETVARLRAHVGEARWPSVRPPANASPLPMPPHAFDAAAVDVVRDRFRADFEAFGYEDSPSEGAESPAAWEARVAPLLPLLGPTIDAHARVAQLHRLAQRRGARVQALEARIESQSRPASARRAVPAGANLEGRRDFDVHWGWADGPPAPGFTAVVRARDEARALPWSLPPLLRAVSRVVLVDNGSTDGTAMVARRAAEAAGGGARLAVSAYPFPIARCGEEHLATPAASLHSLTYFYNWCFARVRTGYALKWDADMVLTDGAVAALADLAWQLEATETVVRVPRLALYVGDERHAWVDTALRNCEPWAWPNRPGYSFVKALEWELPMFPPQVASVTLPDFGCVELKFLDADEFAHWSPTDFAASPRTARKRRESEVFHALASGGPPPAGVEPVEAPPGMHVVDFVRTRWLPQRAARLTPSRVAA